MEENVARAPPSVHLHLMLQLQTPRIIVVLVDAAEIQPEVGDVQLGTVAVGLLCYTMEMWPPLPKAPMLLALWLCACRITLREKLLGLWLLQNIVYREETAIWAHRNGG